MASSVNNWSCRHHRMTSIRLFVLGLFCHSAVAFNVFMFYGLSVWLCFFSDIIDIFRCRPIAIPKNDSYLILLTFLSRDLSHFCLYHCIVYSAIQPLEAASVLNKISSVFCTLLLSLLYSGEVL